MDFKLQMGRLLAILGVYLSIFSIDVSQITSRGLVPDPNFLVPGHLTQSEASWD